MQIILLQDVEHVGYQNEVVNVKPGYARNYLIPKGFAKMATKAALKMHAENVGTSVSIGAKASENGKIFGSVNSIQLAEALAAKGFQIERKQISLKEDAIKSIGSYEAKVKLHKEVEVVLPFEVVAE